MRQPDSKTAIAERARAARRAAQLRREAGERAEAEAKLNSGDTLTKNDVLAMLGSAHRIPEEMSLTEAFETGIVTAGEVDAIFQEKTAGISPGKKARNRKPDDYTFTPEEIVRLRDEVGLSWRQVAVNLDLGSPGAARKAYTTLTGKDYKDSAMTGRRTRTTMGTAKSSTRKVYAPLWDDDSDQDEIIERLKGARIIVQRNVKGIEIEDDILVVRVKRLTWDGPNDDGPLTVHFIERDSGATRSIRVSDIKEVR